MKTNLFNQIAYALNVLRDIQAEEGHYGIQAVIIREDVKGKANFHVFYENMKEGVSYCVRTVQAAGVIESHECAQAVKDIPTNETADAYYCLIADIPANQKNNQIKHTRVLRAARDPFQNWGSVPKTEKAFMKHIMA